MRWKNSNKNRRLDRGQVLDVKLRSQQVRTARWRRLRLFFGAALGMGAGLLALWLAGLWALDQFVFENDAFAVRQIELATDGSLPREEIRRWSGVRVGDNLLALDLARIKRDLELVPWIHSAAVERLLPHTLKISVGERVPLAQVSIFRPQARAPGYRKTVFWLDQDGYVMRPQESAPGDAEFAGDEALPKLVGVPPDQLQPGRPVAAPQVHAALRLIELFEHSPLFGVVELAEIDVSDSEALGVITARQHRIVLAPRQLKKQLQRWRIVHDYGLRTGRTIVWLDLSMTNNIPALWAAADSSPPPAKPAAPKPTRKKHV